MTITSRSTSQHETNTIKLGYASLSKTLRNQRVGLAQVTTFSQLLAISNSGFQRQQNDISNILSDSDSTIGLPTLQRRLPQIFVKSDNMLE